jgi:hypothetical protein
VSITEELLGRNSSGSGQENREYDGGIRCADHATPYICKSWYYFAKKRRSLGRHSSLADQSHGVRDNFTLAEVLKHGPAGTLLVRHDTSLASLPSAGAGDR